MTADDPWAWAPQAVHHFLAQQPLIPPLLGSALTEYARRHSLASAPLDITALEHPEWPPLQARIYQCLLQGVLFPGYFTALVAAYPDRTLYWLDDDADTTGFTAFAEREQLVRYAAHQPTLLLDLLATFRGNFILDPHRIAQAEDIPWWSAEAISTMLPDELAEATHAREQVRPLLAPPTVAWNGHVAQVRLHVWSAYLGRLIRIEATFSPDGVWCQETQLASWVGAAFAPR